MPSPRRPLWIALSLVSIVTLAAYHHSFDGPFIFDDLPSVVDNPSLRAWWPISSVLAPPSECPVAGRPLANLTFALNYTFGNLSVRGYHVTNLGFHLGAALFLFGLVRRALDLVGSRAALPLALAVAAIWGAHPLLTGSVSYIAQRTEVMMGFFYLGTLYAFIRGVGVAGQESITWLGLSVVGCFCGIASKEGMVTAPVLVLLFDRSFVAGSLREAWRRRWLYYISLAASWVLLGFLLFGLKDRAVGFGLGVSGWTYALTECRAVLLYLGLVGWPFPLVADYGASFASGIRDVWPQAVMLLLALGGSGLALWRWPRAGFLATAFFLVLAPTSSVVPVANQPIAENRAYLPAAAAIALATVGLYRATGGKAWAIAATMVPALVGLTVQRNELYRDRLALWSDTLLHRPGNDRIYEMKGEALHGLGRYAEARQEFETALRMNPQFAEAYNNLGSTLIMLGDAAGAERAFKEAVRLKPDYAGAHNNLGNLALRLGRLDEARRHAEEALRLFSDPRRLRAELPETHNNLGTVLLHQNDIRAASVQFREALRLKPDFLEARMNLGVMLRLLGETEEAKMQLEGVVAAKPDNPEAQFNLGVLYQQLNRMEEAIVCFNRALQLRPDFPEAHANLAHVLETRGDLTAARIHLEAVLRLRPNPASQAALDRLLAALAARGPSAAPASPR